MFERKAHVAKTLLAREYIELILFFDIECALNLPN